MKVFILLVAFLVFCPILSVGALDWEMASGSVDFNWPLKHLFVLQKGRWWHDLAVYNFVCHVEQTAIEGPLGIFFYLEPSHELTDIGWAAGLGYKDLGENQAADNLLAVGLARASVFLKPVRLYVWDRLQYQIFGPYVPLEKLEANQFDFRMCLWLRRQETELVRYGFNNLRPFGQRQEGILAQRYLRLGYPFQLATNQIIVGWQAASQRFASEKEVWRWRSWIGCYGIIKRQNLALEIGYGYGQLQRSRPQSFEEKMSHRLMFELALTPSEKEVKS